MVEKLKNSPNVFFKTLFGSLKKNKNFDDNISLNKNFKETDIDDSNLTLSALMLKKQYYPVLIFGSTTSGKSTLLTSLFKFMRTDPSSNATIHLGDWIIPTHKDEGSMTADEASQFFNKVVSEFESGTAAASTRANIPFFIPLTIKPNNDSGEIKIAILESRGEFYNVNEGNIRYNPELLNEIKDIYENYSKPISILIIAPYTNKASNRPSIRF
jgi:energy-coupling factor transporter ATP-binding protein EcfA2